MGKSTFFVVRTKPKVDKNLSLLLRPFVRFMELDVGVKKIEMVVYDRKHLLAEEAFEDFCLKMGKIA